MNKTKSETKKEGIGCRGDSTETFVKKAKRKFGEKITYEKTVYKRRYDEVTVNCVEHGEFKAIPAYFLRSNHGCPSCGNKVTREQFIEKSRNVHGDKYNYEKVIYKNTTTPVEVVCPTHGSFWPVPYSHYSRNWGCPGCFQERNGLTRDQFIVKCKEKHGDKYDYSKVTYDTNTSIVTIGCPQHGDFIQPARVHLAGHGCKRCNVEKTRLGKEDFILKAKEIHGDKYRYDKVVYKNNKLPVKIECPQHGIFKKSPNGHVSSKAGCPVCQESKGEKRVRVFLEKHGIAYEREYRIKPFMYRYDFYVPEISLLIEFNGQQHYMPIDIFGGMKAFRETVERDKVKKELAEKNGYYLITLTYKQMGEDALEKILRGAFGYKGVVLGNQNHCPHGPRVAEMSH